jgi:hypothetical protein
MAQKHTKTQCAAFLGKYLINTIAKILIIPEPAK